MDALQHYSEIWAVDFEFTTPSGERPTPLCCVARDLRTGRQNSLWFEGDAPAFPPYGIGPEALFIAYYASAELGCHIALDWPAPVRILDLYAEFRCLTAGLSTPCGAGLLGALAYFGLDGLAASEKDDMRQLAMRGGPYTTAERSALLAYCETDVDALARLLPRMLPNIDLPRALLRGRYMAAAARMEWNGIPVDAEGLDKLWIHWHRIKSQIISAIDASYGIFERADRRPIDPQSTLGAALLETANEWGIDPHDLAGAVEDVWAQEREVTAGRVEAIRAARRTTGLTMARTGRWEDAGKDHSSWPGLDGAARELAGMFPELGIGHGYDPDAVDENDNAGLLWDLLREPTPATAPRHHPDILSRAAELVYGAGQTETQFGPLRFSATRWANYLALADIPWPMTETGAMALDKDTFKEMARAYPAAIGPIREALLIHRGELKRIDLAVGADGRNRVLLSAFASKTGRNQPSNSRFIFGPSTWLRSLIRPMPGRAVAYVDWSAQELGIAAALSGDAVMREAYRSGDPYLFLAKKAGAVPPDATKQSHGAEREQFKVVSLGVLYGLSADGVARRLNVPPCRGRELLQLHQQTFRRFWEWSDQTEMGAMLTGQLRTVFGWTLHVPPGFDAKTGKPLANPRSLRNFPMQGNGAEMLRLACCLATERGIVVCAPIHDALLVESNAGEIDAVVRATQAAMQEASRIVLDGFELRTDSKIVRYPDRYVDDRGRRMWETVRALLSEIDAPIDALAGARTPSASARGCPSDTPSAGARGPLAPAPPPPSLISYSLIPL